LIVLKHFKTLIDKNLKNSCKTLSEVWANSATWYYHGHLRKWVRNDTDRKFIRQKISTISKMNKKEYGVQKTCNASIKHGFGNSLNGFLYFLYYINTMYVCQHWTKKSSNGLNKYFYFLSSIVLLMMICYQIIEKNLLNYRWSSSQR